MRNIGTYRMQVFDGRTTGMHWQRHKGGAQHYRVAERLGKRLRGGRGARPRTGADVLRDGADAGGARRAAARRASSRSARVELVKCVTVDLEVPASAQIVLEGYVEPGERRREGPFGDHTGFYSQPDDYPVFHLTCITQRKKPDVPHDRRRHSADGGLLSRQGERADLPAAHPEDAARDRRHALSRRTASSTTSSSSRSTSAIRATRARS